MPVARYDDEDYDDQDEAGPRWRRWLFTALLAATGLALGFLVPYMLYLNQQVGARFDELRWQIPTRVYARPLLLGEGLAMDAPTLKMELVAAGYREDGGRVAGTFAAEGGRFSISSRGYVDVDGPVPARRVEVRLSGGRVSAVRDLADDKPLKVARLDPARIATLYGQNQEERRLVRIDEVPELLVTGLQAVEDRDFNRHHGIDLSGILRATWVNLRAGEVRQGASTLTQLLARSGLLGIGREQTWNRKLNEILYALIIEARYDKRTILEAFLNQVYLGQRGSQAIHGVASGAEFWFGRSLDTLTTEQTALMIAIIKGPSYYDPRRNPERAKQRRDFALTKMHASGLIDAAELKRAQAAPLGVARTPGVAAANRYPAYVDLVRRQLARDYPADALQGAGLTVLTGMAPSAQLYAERAVQDTLKQLQGSKRPPLQAGLVLTDVHGGDVLAVVGDRDVAKPGFNRALEAQRPVGSLLKPFVYLLALAQPQRWSLDSWVEDTPVTVRLERGRRWTPGNSDGTSHGSVRLIDALAHSYNQATVRLGMQVDPKRLTELLRVLAGIQAEPLPALILGATDQSPYAMTQLYQFLASGGEIQPLHAVRGVIDPQGRLVKRYDERPAPPQEGDSIAANLIGVALQHVVNAGTARRLQSDGLGKLASAGKTGTSNDSRDSWYAGYTGDHLGVIWVGNDQNEPTGLYGGTGAMRVWSDIFAKLPSAPLQVPQKGIEWAWVEAMGNQATDAECPGARRFAFVAGYAPPYVPCAPPAPVYDPEEAAASQEEGRGGWRRWFGLDRQRETRPQAPPVQDNSQPASTEPPQ